LFRAEAVTQFVPEAGLAANKVIESKARSSDDFGESFDPQQVPTKQLQ
jgi:hypothetical protein